jgi:iron(II)-dependent oxidoreductase
LPLPQNAISPELKTTEIQEPVCAPIMAGEFIMGCARGRDDERPEHRVGIDAFEMAVFQTRNRDFAAFMEATGHPAPPNWNQPDFAHPDHPVIAVSWFEAQKYCEWLSQSTGRSYRLPTEAEWEWAALGGSGPRLYPWGDEDPLTRVEYQRRWSGEVRGPLPVGQGEPNGFGIYDLCENVHEWCADWYKPGYYASSESRNPAGPATGDRRASRGGSWRHHVKACRLAARSSIPPHFQYADYGFRVVRDGLTRAAGIEI